MMRECGYSSMSCYSTSYELVQVSGKTFAKLSAASESIIRECGYSSMSTDVDICSWFRAYGCRLRVYVLGLRVRGAKFRLQGSWWLSREREREREREIKKERTGYEPL